MDDPPTPFSLSPAFFLRLLDEDGVHHESERHPHHSCRGVTGTSGDGVGRPATGHVAKVMWFDGPPQGYSQTGVEVAPALTAEHGVLRVVDRAGTVPTVTVFRLAHPTEIGTEYTVPGERLRRGE